MNQWASRKMVRVSEAAPIVFSNIKNRRGFAFSVDLPAAMAGSSDASHQACQALQTKLERDFGLHETSIEYFDPPKEGVGVRVGYTCLCKTDDQYAQWERVLSAAGAGLSKTAKTIEWITHPDAMQPPESWDKLKVVIEQTLAEQQRGASVVTPNR